MPDTEEILVLDDDPSLGNLLAHVLDGDGYGVTYFCDERRIQSRDAIAHASVHPSRRLSAASFRPRNPERSRRPQVSGGLSIAKEIIARLGGTLSFADAPGGGTLFCVTLPIATRGKQWADGTDEKEVA
jgi:hypothetical protein